MKELKVETVDMEPTKKAVERELLSLTKEMEQKEKELERLQRLINDLKAMHNINAVFRRDIEEEFYD